MLRYIMVVSCRLIKFLARLSPSCAHTLIFPLFKRNLQKAGSSFQRDMAASQACGNWPQASVSACAQERQEGGGVFRDPVIQPSPELEVTELPLLVGAALRKPTGIFNTRKFSN